MPYAVPAVPPEPSRPTRAARVLVALLFTIVTVVALAVPLYNRTAPAVAGIPFFYWFQMAWILAAAGATAMAYRLKV
jgi:cytochrome b561